VLDLLDPASLRARVAGRSYWRLRYTDGKVVSEWDTDWSLAPHDGRQSLRLYCPNGQVAELGNSGDATGRLFQLKVATIGMGQPSQRQAHLIGIVDTLGGQCRYAAWDYDLRQLVTGIDNAYNMRYHNVGLLAFDVLGLDL
jgi:hypothetical protein